jgi:hypothetical protein
LREKTNIPVPDSLNPSSINVSLPLPEVRNEIDGEMVSIFWAIPEELRSIFDERVSRILGSRMADVEEIGPAFLRQQVTPFMMASLNNAFLNKERERHARNDDDELWKIAAEEFGLHPFALPFPLFAVSA